MPTSEDYEVRDRLPASEIRAAREWWFHLPPLYKGRCSIWMLLALYAHHVHVQSVDFDADQKVAEIGK
jgi:hypothetical protein